jgi:2-iminobutanoate/2-iminopropanoate deaminase
MSVVESDETGYFPGWFGPFTSPRILPAVSRWKSHRRIFRQPYIQPPRLLEIAMLRAINPPGSSIPGISQAILVERGRLLMLSGHVPFDSDGNVVGTELPAQLDQVFSNLRATLQAASTDFSSVARLTIYVRDYESRMLPVIRSVRDRWINAECPPASALIGVASLFHPDVLVEVDAIAALPD